MLNRVVGLLEKVFTWVTTVLFVVMIIAVLVQIVARYALPSAPPWTEEATRFALIFMVAFASGIAVRGRHLVNVDILVNEFPPAVRRVLVTAVDLLTLVFGVTFFWYTIEYVERSTMQEATTLPISMAWITGSVLMIAGSLALFTLANLLDDFTGRGKERQP